MARARCVRFSNSSSGREAKSEIYIEAKKAVSESARVRRGAFSRDPRDTIISNRRGSWRLSERDVLVTRRLFGSPTVDSLTFWSCFGDLLITFC